MDNDTKTDSQKEKNPVIWDDVTHISFCAELGKYLALNGSVEVLLNEVNNKIKNAKDITKPEIIVMKLILVLNPSTKTLNTKANQKLILNLIQHLNDMKQKGFSIKTINLYKYIEHFLGNESLVKYLFEDVVNLDEKDEKKEAFYSSYLDILIPFIIDREIGSLIGSLKACGMPKEEIVFITNLFEGIDLKSKKGIIFLKNILQLIINNRNNVLMEIQNFVDNYFNNVKNEFFRCNKCYDFPQLNIGEDKKVYIKYTCDHVKGEDILNPINIQNYRFKCSVCQNDLYEFKKNYLCSNCKQLICNKCTKSHFIECFTLFFIPLSNIGLICPDHNSKFESFCSVCKKNLCLKCKEEHHHFSYFSEKTFAELNKNEIKEKINSKIEIEEPLKNLLNSIISDDIYYRNFQFKYFFSKLVGKAYENLCGLFKEFGDENFNGYYPTLIKEYKKGNLYYMNVYDDIKEVYSKEKLKINTHIVDYIDLYKNSKNDTIIHVNNAFKAGLLSNYFIKFNEVKDILKREIEKCEEYNLKIQMEKYEIKSNPLSFQNDKYKSQTIKLINRSIADNIIRALIKNYPKKFCQINIDLNLYNDIKENFKGNADIIKNFEKAQKARIKDLLEEAQNNLNDSANNSGETDDSENSNNQIIFNAPISINNIELSVKDLNIMLEYLFYIKNNGNSTAHPNNKTTYLSQNCFDDDKANINDHQKFIFDLINSLKKTYFKENIENKYLFQCLFEGKCDNLLMNKKDSDEEREINKIKEQDNNDEVPDEFKKIDETFNSLKVLISSLIPHNKKGNIINETILKDFYKRLYQVFDDKDSALKALNTIFNVEYKNCLFGDITSFIKGCFDYIINNIIKRNKDTITKFNKSIEDLKSKRKDRQILLKRFININENSLDFEKKEKTNIQNSSVNGFIDFLNNKENDDKKKYKISDGKTLLSSIMKNVEILIKDKIQWTNYNKQKLLSLLCLYQNQEEKKQEE